MNKKILLPAAVAVIVTAAAAYGAIGVSAQQSNRQDSLVKRIAERFGLNESEVQAVFDEMKEEHQQEMQLKFEQRLEEAVENGLITEEQKKLIQVKHAEFLTEREENREAIKNMTPEESKKAMEQHKQEMDKWAEENGLDMKMYFFGGGKGEMHHIMKVK